MKFSWFGDYIEDLKGNISRLKQINKYYNHMTSTKSEKKKNYYLEGIKMLLFNGEKLENHDILLEEYKQALSQKKDVISNLFNEIKIIKKLKV
ncbi:MAG: hypothetical protein HUJ68_03765 [Clostridia bacterium]|nr:hypothetical protein [Clostridia bacterium]